MKKIPKTNKAWEQFYEYVREGREQVAKLNAEIKRKRNKVVEVAVFDTEQSEDATTAIETSLKKKYDL